MNENVNRFAKYVALSAGMDENRVEVLDYDLDRVYLSYNGTEYNIRMWSITSEEVQAYTLYRMVSEGRASHGEEVFAGEHYYF